MNKKGFSLVELIIVIAIMAILVGVMAPQLIKYIEKTNVSSDTQLCDTVKSAITTAMMDPEVLADASAVSTINSIGSTETQLASLSAGTTAFHSAIAETLGCGLDDVDAQLKSWNSASTGGSVSFQIVSGNSCHVYIKNSDASGKKTSTTNIIYVD